ncbi:class I SAM-dependent methyltransferase [Mesorhizobium sp. WSM3859]|uniref:class I SAM-dependent methyltransferase n=1 Tax=Mesorhizobium sp. WSM3859 TaxID=2029402 RepID=UPI000BB0BFF9|nr:class I SAM-dependent methyltransferase [Mesorhizobium sp. WSM3859]PBC11612.1 SAM-dependent methyltransferase [Mesorhizobium sp. WSM3859]
MTTIEDFRKCSDSEWLEMLVASVRSPVVSGLKFPSFPPDALQSMFVGSANENALQEAHNFYALMKLTAKRHGNPIGRDSAFLDFGTGWGRFLRFAWKDVAENCLFGVDIDPDVIALTKSNGVAGNLSVIDPLGKLKLPDASIDAILAYSVFTHLPEPVHLHWMEEFKRVTRHRAIVALTLEPRRFLEFVASLEGKAPESGWHAGLQRFSAEAKSRLADFDAGRLVYLPTGGGDHRSADIYGDAICPIQYLMANWGPEFTVRVHIDDASRFWQAVVVMQRL